MDTTLKLADLAVVFATLAGPILALQAQRWLDKRREVNSRKMSLFRTLMATRVSRLSPEHVEALNATAIDFYGESEELRAITGAWRLYMEHLNRTTMPFEQWLIRGDDLYADLLYSMAKHLRYKFDKVQLQREIYRPKGFLDAEVEQDKLKKGLIGILEGSSSLLMDVRSFPVDPTIREATPTTQMILDGPQE
jgi:hypothetical protein